MTHNQTSFGLAPDPTDPSIIRCKKCRDPLPNTAWKNCERCRRIRTASHHRWKKSAELNKELKKLINLPIQTGRMNQNSSTSSQQDPGRSAHLRWQISEPSHPVNQAGPSRLSNDQPRMTTASPASHTIQVIEYQWSNDLISALSSLPPRSRFVGKFSIVADPAVNNSMRAHMFANELRAKAIPISEDSQPTSLPGTSNSYSIVFSCTCQEACPGRFIVSVDDDTSHPYGVPGQRIGAILLH